MSDEPAAQPEQKAASASAWKKAREHTIRLPSGVYVGIVVPDLPKLIETGVIPQNLLDAAVEAAKPDRAAQADKEQFANQREFTDKLVQLTVVKPALSDADVADVPYEDKEMIVEIATRQRDLDVEGNHIGGLHKSDAFRKFRGLDAGDEIGESL